MDYNQLQRTLYDIEPGNPQEELRNLREAAGSGGQAPAPQPVTDYSSENYDAPQGSLGLDKDYSVSDFAALAGVQLSESQKNADYARGSDSTPKAKPGRTKHPLDDKLVGSYEYDEDDVEEDFTDAVKQGYKNPQDIKKAFAPTGSSKKGAASKGGAAKQAPSTSMNPKLVSKLENYSGQLETIFRNAKLRSEFEKFLNTHAPKKESAAPRNTNKDSIKESLLKALNEYEKKK